MKGMGNKRLLRNTKNKLQMAEALSFNYFKYKWIKFSNQKTRDRRIKTYVYKPTVCCLQETQFSFKDPHRFKVKG